MTLSTRITKNMKQQLLRSAKESGRSLSQEIEFRLEQSYRDEKALYREFGGEKAYLFGKWFAVALRTAEYMTGQSWEDDPETFLTAVEAMQALRMKELEGKDIPDEKSLKESGKMLAEMVFSKPSKNRQED